MSEVEKDPEAQAQEPTDPTVEPDVAPPADAAAVAGDAPAEAGESEATESEEEIDPLTAAFHEAAMWRDTALRSKAELENFRKRMARERQESARYANADLLQALFPVLDNFEFGLQAAKAEEGSSIYLGMQMVHKQIQDFLTDQGVESVPAEGQPFDPNVHDAVAQEPSDTVPEGHVVAQVRSGYRMHERLLRPAAVRVSTGVASPADADPNAQAQEESA